jgi:hypothetical protein
VIDWLNGTQLSSGQNLDVSGPDAPAGLEAVQKLRHAWKTTLQQIMAGHDVQPRFIKQLNRILCLDTFSETLGVESKIGFHFHRSRSLLAGEQLALALLARSIAEFLVTAEFKFCAVARTPIPVSSFSMTPPRTIGVSGVAIRCAAIGTKWPSSGAGNAAAVANKGSDLSSRRRSA